MNKNITQHNFKITRNAKELKYQTTGCVLWLTGLSGSGKSTIASELESLFFENNTHVKVLDGDNIRHALNQDLGFSVEDRSENLRRIAEVAKLFVENATVTICSFISPLASQRTRIADIIGTNNFNLIYVNTSLSECEKRDPKGLYQKARKGEIKSFTGIDSEYQIPTSPTLEVTTLNKTPQECAREIFNFYNKKIKA